MLPLVFFFALYIIEIRKLYKKTCILPDLPSEIIRRNTIDVLYKKNHTNSSSLEVKRMKKALAILLAFSMLLSMSACGGSTAPAAGSAETEQGTDAVEDAAETKSAAEDQNLNTDTNEPAAEAATAAVSEQAAQSDASSETAATAQQAAQSDASSETTAQAEADPGLSAQAQSPVGSYKLTGHTGNFENEMNDIINIVRLGGRLYLTLKEDGTGSINLLEAEMPLEWDNSDIIIQPKEGADFTDPVRISYACEGESLKISASDYSLDFNRLNEQELAEYKENGAGSLKGQLSKISQILVGNIEDSLGDLLFLALTLGGNGTEKPPIPKGEPSADPVSGTVNGIAFNILGADQVQSDEGPLIVFYFEATNTTDDYQEIWYNDFEASQNDAFLEQTWGLGDIPEEGNVDLGMAPGRTIRCADIYKYDPDGGVVGYRISCFKDKDKSVLYYADPGNLTGAPAEPFVFDDDPSVPEFVQALPGEVEDVRMENAEFFTDEDGNDNIRIYFTFRNTSEKDELPFCVKYSCYALQDGITLPMNFIKEPCEEEDNYVKDIKPGEEILCANSYKLRTGSPVSFIVYEDKGSDEMIYAAAKTYEVK